MKYSLWIVAILAFPALAQQNAKVPDPDPEVERMSFIVAPGFEVTLWAADPLLAKPIQMNWDAQGRLWVATSEVYPQIKPGQVANDKILILEDTKNSGKADKVTVFADGLLIPTGVLPGDGGAYVANSTEILHLSASKPGEKADKKRVVLSGFGTEDTHHIIHTFKWGPDGAMYFNQSVYIHSHVETPHGTVRLNGGGVWRYEPRTQKLSVFLRGFWNPWGHAFDKYGNSFLTDGAGSEGIYHGVPGASYVTGHNQAPRVLHGLNPGSPKYCGLEIVSGRHFPDDWQGDLITNDFRGHRVCRFKLRDDGSTYESREMPELIKSTHPAFRPIDCLMGPDGALYIADWYNPIIQHGEVDFRDPRRDKTRGRIWRVTAKGRAPVSKPAIADAGAHQLFEMLGAEEGWTRQMAKRRMFEYDKKFVEVNETEWWREQENISRQTRLELMQYWTALGTKMDIRNLCNFPEVGYRTAGYRLFSIASNASVERLLPGVTDASPRVRLEAVRTLATLKSPAAVSVSLKVLDLPMDPTLDYALRLSLQELQDQWLPAFKEGKFDYGNDMKKLAFALEAVQSPEVVKPLVGLLKADKFPEDKRVDAWVLIAKLGGPNEVSEAIRFSRTWPPSDALMAAIEDSARRGVKPPLSAMELMIRKHPHIDDDRMCRLIGHWKLEGYRKDLESLSSDSNTPVHPGALQGIALLGGPKSVAFLARQVQGSEPMATASLVTLVPLDAPQAAKLAADRLATLPMGAGEVVEAFLKQKNGAALLAKALESKTLPPDVAKLALNAVRASGNPSPALTAALTKAGNLTVAKEPSPEEIKALTADVPKLGDAARGEAVFRRRDMQCLNCHAIGGAGGQVGPDLSSIGASAQIDYLVESLLLPNKAIKEGYHTVDVTLQSGKIVSGVKVREGNGELVLREKDDKEIALRLDDIDTRRNGRSLMPDGQTEPLTRGELLHLTRFLSELGKVGPYELSKSRLVRRWETLEPTKDALQLLRGDRNALLQKPAAFNWPSTYSKVNGELPLADVPAFTAWKSDGPQSAVRFKLNVTTAGEVKLDANAAGLSMFAGEKSVKPNEPFPLPAGVHEIIVLVDRAKRSDALRIELADVSGSAVRVSIVGGK